MKKFNLFTLLLLAIGFGFTGCGDDDTTAPDAGVTITGIPATEEIENLGTLGPVTATLNAPDGLASFSITRNGAAFGDVVTYEGETTATVDFTYTAEEEDADNNIVFEFTAKDEDGDEATFTHVLSVGEAPEVGSSIVLTQNIEEDVTWSAINTYVLAGRIIVEPGATLTIEPGTVIKGQFGAGTAATALVIARGAKIMAEGTAELPIIFTSIADNITPQRVASGDFSSPNLSPETSGQWGGLVILGKARISASAEGGEDATEQTIEGIPTSEGLALYGGDDDEDNSGVLKYISIRHGGTEIAPGNELNGLSLGGIGRGTVIENIEVVANEDDGVEWFGGTVNVKNVIVWNSNDDGIDTDNAWAGTLDNFVVVTAANGGHVFELDGPEGSYNASHTIQNGTIVASADGRASDQLINTDANSRVTLRNIHFTGVTAGQKVNRVSAPDGELIYENITLDVPEAELSNYIEGGVVPAGISVGTEGRADVSVFGWTWTAQAGKTAGL